MGSENRKDLSTVYFFESQTPEMIDNKMIEDAVFFFSSGEKKRK